MNGDNVMEWLAQCLGLPRIVSRDETMKLVRPRQHLRFNHPSGMVDRFTPA